METSDKRELVPAGLIQVVQLPVITEQLRTMKAEVERRTAAALSLACTEETLQAVKAERAELSKQFSALEDCRKAVKNAILKPYNDFETVYKECVSEPFQRADAGLKGKINDVESAVKQRCEDSLREYFAELCAVHHLEWLTYEQAGIKIDMASAKAKTPKKLREQLQTFVVSVSGSVERISALENAGEIMVEFRKSLNAADAICTVQERHRRIEEQKAASETRNAAVKRDDEAVRRVEALAPPAEAKPERVISRLSLVFYDITERQLESMKPFLRELKKIADMEGIRYE